MTNDKIIIHAVGYADDADLDVNERGEVQNHDELVNKGKTFDELRALKDSEQNRETIPERMIVEEGDPMWSETCENMDVGESKKLIE